MVGENTNSRIALVLTLVFVTILGGCTVPDVNRASVGRETEARPVPSVSNEYGEPTKSSRSGVDQRLRDLADGPTLDKPVAVDLPTVLRFVGETRETLAVLIARENAAAADAGKFSAALGFFPSVRPRLSWFRHEGRIQDTQGEFLDVDKQNAFGGVGLELALNPADAVFQTLSAYRRADASHADLETASQETLREAAHRFYDLVLARQRQRIQQEALVRAQAFVELQQARAEQGVGLAVDALRARAHAAEVQGQIAETVGDLHVASARLVELLRLDERIELEPIRGQPLLVEFVSGDVPTENLVEKARASRPELTSAEELGKALDVEKQRLGYGWAIPQIRGGVSFGEFGPTISARDTEDQESYYLALELELEANRYSRWKEASHQRRSLEFQRQRLERRIVAEVISARWASRAARQRVDAVREQVGMAEEAVRISQSRHSEGAALFLEVLDAQESLIRARSELAEATISHNRAQYDLVRAIGGA